MRAHVLVKTFGEGRATRRVLDDAHLEVALGEVVAVLGRSGSDKSTLLHLLGGLDRPDAGVIEVGGERVTGASERTLSALRRRRVGFVFQLFHLLPELTGEANVLLAARVRGAHPDAKRRARVLVDELGLRPVAHSLPHRLSGGEQLSDASFIGDRTQLGERVAEHVLRLAGTALQPRHECEVRARGGSTRRNVFCDSSWTRRSTCPSPSSTGT